MDVLRFWQVHLYMIRKTGIVPVYKKERIKMRSYNHTTSEALTKIEKGFDSHIVKTLHDLYEDVRYRFLTADEFCLICQDVWYHFTGLFEDGPENKHGIRTHVWAGVSRKLVVYWYNQMLKDNPSIVEVGTPATVYYWSDRKAATVTSVEYYKSGKKDAAGNPIPKEIGVNLNKVECIDYYAGNYNVIPMTDPEDLKLVHNTFTLRKGGRWVDKGCNIGDGLELGIGYQIHFIDPCF